MFRPGRKGLILVVVQVNWRPIIRRNRKFQHRQRFASPLADGPALNQVVPHPEHLFGV
jgi:hypothetical protein